MSKPPIIVENGGPPPTIRKPGRQSTWPFSDMKQVNNTFFAPGMSANSMHSAIRRFRNKFPEVEFTLRTTKEVVKGEEDKGEQEGVRVWRTK